MAQAIDTLIEWSLEDYLDDLIAKSGCKTHDALCELRERLVHGRLILIRQRLVDDKPYNPWDRKPYNKEVIEPCDFDSRYSFSLKSDFRGGYKVHVSHVASHDSFEYRYTVAEQDKTGDPVEAEADDGLSAGESPQESKAEGWQVRRLKKALKEKYPPNGHPPVDMTLTAILKSVDGIFEREGWKLASPDTLARIMGRRRT
jgi:hypothetical protein